MKSIKSLIAAEATVIRDGRQQTIAAADVVVGDLVVLSMGDRVPSDLRLVETSTDLKFDRSLLTGERSAHLLRSHQALLTVLQ
jgi:sodium/potassium-transporting ATPase subunit alpha